jgi:hypothetical protein
VANKGPGTQGYVPRKDVVLSWPTFTDAAKEAGASRLIGGIHIAAGNDEGLELGEMVGKVVWKRYRGLIKKVPKPQRQRSMKGNKMPRGMRKMHRGMRMLYEKSGRKYNNIRGEMMLNQRNGVRGTMTNREFV